MRFLRSMTAYCLLIFLFGFVLGQHAHAAPPFSGLVMSVADGDTLTVMAGGVPHRVRLAEIDAPEKAQPFGTASREHLRALCHLQAAEILPQKRDKYGRLLARVRCNGRDAGLEPVRAGMAWAYPQYATDPAVIDAEAAARFARAGLWADDNPIPPWQFRKGPI